MHVTTESVIRVLDESFLDRMMELQETLSKIKNKETRKKVYIRLLCGNKCAYCNDYGTSVNHIVPKAKGGTDHISNLTCCCYTCNMMKGEMTATEFQKLINLEGYELLSERKLKTIIKQVGAVWQSIPNEKHHAVVAHAKNELAKRLSH